MKSFHVHPDHLKRSGGKLGGFGGKLADGGKKLDEAGQRLVSHAGGDRSGIGSVIAKVFGKGLGITGKVFGEGGRVAKGAGDRLHGAGRAYEELDGHGGGLLKKLHPDAKNAAPMPPAAGGSRSGGGAGSSGGRGRGGIMSRIHGRVRPVSIPPESRRCTKDPVDLASGEVLLSQTDVELPGVLPLVLSRTHLSSYAEGRSFGSSWASTVDQRLEVSPDGVVFVGAAGVLLVYPLPALDGDAVFAEEGPRWPLRFTADGFVLEDLDSRQFLNFPGPVGELGEVPAEMMLHAINDRNGHRIDFARDVDGVLTEVRHSGGYRIAVTTVDGCVTRYSLRANGDLSADGGTDGGGDVGESVPIRRFGFDETGNLAEVINPSGLALRFSYDAAGRLTEWVDRNGMWYRYHYDEQGRCVVAEGAGGRLTTSLSYDRQNMVTTETNSLGHLTSYHLNDALQVVKTVDPLGAETVSEFDRYDRLLSSIDPLGRRTSFEYTEAGDLARVTRPDGSQRVAEFNDQHLPLTVVDPDGAVWRREFDAAGNLRTEPDPAGATTHYAYDAAGHLTSIVDAHGAATTIACDAVGLPISVVNPLGANTFYQRDGFGRVVRITDPVGGATRMSWTVDGHLVSRTEPDGTTESWTYDGEGNQVEHIDGLGQITRTEYAGFDLPVAQTDPAGGRTVLAYDTELRLTSVTNPAGLIWRYTYDPTGNVVSETDVNGRRIEYARDITGQVIAITNGVGQVTELARDALGRVTDRRAIEGVTRFTYDEADRLVRATSPDADLVLQRDVLGRITTETCNGRTLVNTYDRLGRRVSRVTPTGAASEFTYSPAGDLLALRTGGHTIDFGYDPAGREVSRRLGEVVLAQTWDANHRLHTQAITAPSGAPHSSPNSARQQRLLQRRAYTYREDGSVTNIVDQLAGVRHYELDPLGRVTGVDGPGHRETYGYDAAGNIINADWPQPAVPGTAEVEETIAAQGERTHTGTLVRSAGRVRYEHDAQGRLTARHARTLSGRDRTWRYTWTSDDRLAAVTTPDGVAWSYRYDPLGRRIAKLRLTSDGQVADRLDLTWDGTALVEQTEGGGHTTTWNYRPGTYTPLTQTERAPLRDAPQSWIDQQFYGIITDLVGSPTELLTPEGDVAWRHVTTLWGETLFAGRQRASCPLRFPGQYHDVESGQHYNFQRYYSPSHGTYTAADPLGLDAGPNPHSYVPNPTAWLDPLGLTPCQRPAHSPHYSVAFEAQLQRGTHFPGRSDRSHFAEGNRQLHAAFQSDPAFAREMENLYPGIINGVAPGRRGAFPRRPPQGDLTWHHHATRQGVLQLIPREHHRAPGPVQGSLHPGGRGGMENWGGGR